MTFISFILLNINVSRRVPLTTVWNFAPWRWISNALVLDLSLDCFPAVAFVASLAFLGTWSTAVWFFYLNFSVSGVIEPKFFFIAWTFATVTLSLSFFRTFSPITAPVFFVTLSIDEVSRSIPFVSGFAASATVRFFLVLVVSVL